MESWALVSEHDGGETYVNVNSISRSDSSTHAEFKRVYMPPIVDEFRGKLVSSLRTKEEHDLVNKKCRVHARCYRYADGSQRNLGGDGFWTFVEEESEARLRFIQVYGSDPVVNPDLPSKMDADTVMGDIERDLRERYGPGAVREETWIDRLREFSAYRTSLLSKQLDCLQWTSLVLAIIILVLLPIFGVRWYFSFSGAVIFYLVFLHGGKRFLVNVSRRDVINFSRDQDR